VLFRFVGSCGITNFVAYNRNEVEPKEKQDGQLNGLDWLRGAASLMVCLFHIKKYVWADRSPNELLQLFDFGYLGVYIFFIVSGFVIPYSLDRSGYKTGKFGRFIFKRLVRIQPPYLLLLLLLLLWNFGLHEWKGWGTTWLFGWKKFLLNATYLVPFSNERWVFSIFWTLAVEFQYYVLIGLLFLVLRDHPALRYITFSLIVASSFVVPVHYQTVFNHGIYFLVGFQVFLYQTGRLGRIELVASLIGALLFIGFFGLSPTLLPVLLTVAMLILFHHKNRIAGHFGTISYSLYLTHGLAGAATVLLTAGKMDNWGRFTFAVTVSIIFATIYYRFVESPFLRFSKRIRY
jgi:peptidoglycan/LPS O-acetylase OafA/YrhL